MSVIDKSIGLDDLDFSVRTWKVLKNAEVRTLGDLLDKTPADLWEMKHMGKKPMQEIADKLREFGVDVSGFDGVAKTSSFELPKAFDGVCFWSEIRNDFVESGNEINSEIDGDVLARISIDAWKTHDENEEGNVIACVMLSKHGDVLVDYHDNVARLDEMAQGAISDARKHLKEYFKERNCSLEMENGEWTRDNEGVPEFANSGTVKKDTGEASKEVYCLCEEYEGSDAIREFSILAVSTDKDALRKLMEAKIVQDEYGFIKDKGVDEHTEDHFMTNFDCGFVEYYIRDQKVLSREELEHLVSTEVVSKHISEVAKGDHVLFDDCLYTASSDAYMTKTDNGREWNFEVEGEGPEEYLYASYFEGGIVTVARQYREVSLVDKIKDAEESVVRNSCQRSAGNVFER